MRKTTVYLSDEAALELAAKSRRTGRSQAELIRIAVEASLAEEVLELPQSFGMINSGRVGARNFDKWLAENWSVVGYDCTWADLHNCPNEGQVRCTRQHFTLMTN